MQREAAQHAALDELPSGQMYEKSFMHRDTVTHVAVGAHDFVMTASSDGDLRFWKKTPVRRRACSRLRVHARDAACRASAALQAGAWCIVTHGACTHDSR